MIGVLIVVVGALLEELSSSIGKEEVRRKAESVYAMGFLNSLWSVAFFSVLVFWHASSLTLNAWPTFLLRVALSILQAYLTVNAIAKADRSTFGFIRTLTIPLLLVGDLLVGTAVSGAQMAGMALIALGLFFLAFNHGFTKRGLGLSIFSAVNAALAIGVYKYNITHGNSVELEQLLSILIVLGFYYLMSRKTAREHPLKLIKKPLLALQSGAIGFAAVIGSFAYLFAPTSVIIAAARSSTVILTVLSGGVIFREKRLEIKIVSLLAFIAGIVLLAAG